VKVEKLPPTILRAKTQIAPVPFTAQAIASAFRDGDGVWKGKEVGPGISGPTRHQLVQVQPPGSMAEVSEVLRELQRRSGHGIPFLQLEFGIFTYTNQAGELATFVSRGDPMGVAFPSAFQGPSGGEWKLSSIVAHSHPEKHLMSSNHDDHLLEKMKRDSGQRRTLVVGRTADIFIESEAGEVPVNSATLKQTSLEDLFR